MLNKQCIENLVNGDAIFTYDNDIDRNPITLYFETLATIPGTCPKNEVYLIFKDWSNKLYTFNSGNVFLYETREDLEHQLNIMRQAERFKEVFIDGPRERNEFIKEFAEKNGIELTIIDFNPGPKPKNFLDVFYCQEAIDLRGLPILKNNFPLDK